jgi:hypothetical protein
LKPRAATGRTMLCGVNLMVDEVALEERAAHFLFGTLIALAVSAGVTLQLSILFSVLTTLCSPWSSP